MTQHGLSAYAEGRCRCQQCRAAWAAYHRQRRREQRASGGQRLRVDSHVARRAYYHDKQTRVQVALTPLAQRILQAAESRTGERYDDIVERLVREHGAGVEFNGHAV